MQNGIDIIKRYALKHTVEVDIAKIHKLHGVDISDDLRKLEGLLAFTENDSNNTTNATTTSNNRNQKKNTLTSESRRNFRFKKTAANLNGSPLDNYLCPTDTTRSQRNNYQVQPESNDGNQAKNLPANDFFIRLYIPMNTKAKVHVPTHPREMFYQLRRADPTLVLGPMDRTITSQNLFLNHEDALPKDEETCKKYVQGVHFTNGKLKLSMQGKNNISYKDLRAILHYYLLETNITMNFDQIETSSLFPAVIEIECLSSCAIPKTKTKTQRLNSNYLYIV